MQVKYNALLLTTQFLCRELFKCPRRFEFFGNYNSLVRAVSSMREEEQKMKEAYNLDNG